MPPLCKGAGAIYHTRRDCKSAANIEFAALSAFFVFCSVEVPSYIFLRKKTKFKTFLNSLQRVENNFSTRCAPQICGAFFAPLFRQAFKACALPRDFFGRNG